MEVLSWPRMVMLTNEADLPEAKGRGESWGG